MNYLLGAVTLLFFRPGHGDGDGAIAVVASPAAASTYDQSKPQPPISTDIYIYVPLLDFFQICKGGSESWSLACVSPQDLRHQTRPESLQRLKPMYKITTTVTLR